MESAMTTNQDPLNGQEALLQHRSIADRDAKIQENAMRAQHLHQEKMARSTQQFKEARITSCSGVLLRNGKAVCVAF